MWPFPASLPSSCYAPSLRLHVVPGSSLLCSLLNDHCSLLLAQWYTTIDMVSLNGLLFETYYTFTVTYAYHTNMRIKRVEVYHSLTTVTAKLTAKPTICSKQKRTPANKTPHLLKLTEPEKPLYAPA